MARWLRLTNKMNKSIGQKKTKASGWQPFFIIIVPISFILAASQTKLLSNLLATNYDHVRNEPIYMPTYNQEEISFAMCVPPRNIIHAYAQGMMQSREAEVTFCHVDELSTHDIRFLSHVPNSIILDLKDFIPKDNELKFYQSYPCKILCMLAIKKRVVIVMDNDQIPLISPIEMVNENIIQFQKTGWYIGHDTVNKQHSIPALIKSKNFSEWATESYGKSAYDNFLTKVEESPLGRINSAFAESCLVVIDKEIKNGTLRVLQDIHDNINTAKMIYKPQYHEGDKDVFWMACFLTDEDCSLNPWSLGNFGIAIDEYYSEWIGYAITHFHPYESERDHPRMISIQGWITRLGVDSVDLEKYIQYPPRGKFDPNELHGNITWTFSAPLLYDEQVEQIEKGEFIPNMRSMKKVMDPEYEAREVNVFLEVAKRRNSFANQGRELLKTLPK